MNQLKWGFIGSIEKARMFISDIEFATYPHQLEALLTIDNTAERLPNVENFTDLHQFLQSDIEAVYIASPYTMHYAQAKQCLLMARRVAASDQLPKMRTNCAPDATFRAQPYLFNGSHVDPVFANHKKGVVAHQQQRHRGNCFSKSIAQLQSR